MSVKLKSMIFIDTLIFEMSETPAVSLHAVVRDEHGHICSMIDREFEAGMKIYRWGGFGDLPYGVYTLELYGGREKKMMNLVKRV